MSNETRWRTWFSIGKMEINEHIVNLIHILANEQLGVKKKRTRMNNVSISEELEYLIEEQNDVWRMTPNQGNNIILGN